MGGLPDSPPGDSVPTLMLGVLRGMRVRFLSVSHTDCARRQRASDPGLLASPCLANDTLAHKLHLCVCLLQHMCSSRPRAVLFILCPLCPVCFDVWKMLDKRLFL